MKFKPLLLLVTLAAVLPGAHSQAHGARAAEFSAEDRAWWSFQPVREPALPEVRNGKWAVTPVDLFVLARLEAAGLEPAPQASRPALIRRLSFDLTGLPPSREEVEAFAADTDPHAWEKLVDRLLASPRYGERQARLWLDLVRYADSDGYRADHYRPDAWRYRDYVIDAFNRDKPFDRFVREQIAGDELFSGDPQALVATGYLRHWIYEWNNRDVALQREVILNDITDTTADVFMGLGLQCARCHDHKFDPLLQKDYYRLQGFFAALDFPEQTPAVPPSEVEAWEKARIPWLEATADVRGRIDALKAETLAQGEAKAMALFPPETQAMARKAPEARTPFEARIASLTWRQVRVESENVGPKIKGEAKEQLVDLQKELAGFDSLKPAALPMAQAVAEIGPGAPPVLIPRREKAGDVEPGFPSILDPAPAAIAPPPGARSTGRRSALADWLARSDNPLTARVMVNRVWQQHFGQGLSTTASDFGTLGDKPSHPELLDWLASRFVAEGWSVKKLHREILLSAAWRQGHVPSAVSAAKAPLTDPENRLIWRWTTKRLEAEQIRDAIFQASGELDLQAGGPGADHSKPRRAVYTKVLRNVRDPLMDVFDVPQHFQSTAARDTTTTPTQSLFLANSRFMADRAAAMAATLTGLNTPEAQVEAAWWRSAGRPPSTEEREESVAFLRASAPPESAGSSFPPGELAFVSEAMPQRSGKAGVLTPGSAMERLEAAMPPLPAGDFTVEAVALLHSVYETGAVRMLAGQWSGRQTESGWALGITGRQSRRKPQMPVFLLTGTRADGGLVHEPVFSDLTLQMDRSYYLGVCFQPASAGQSGMVTFYVKDLANDDEPLLTASVPHPVAVLNPPAGPLHIGASGAGTDSLWDGLVDEIRLTRGLLSEEETALRRPGMGPRTLACWQFEPGSLRTDSVSGRETLRLPSPSVSAPASVSARPDEALTDLCHALLSSSALLYVE